MSFSLRSFRLSPGEALPWMLAAVLLAARGWFLFRHGVDSDEPQHLHVIFGWWAGEWPYVDRFDNHAPLFHALFLPLAAWVGETPWIVEMARLAILPFSLGALALAYRLASRLYDRRAGAWTLALLLATGDWSLKALEFRPDVVWTFLVLAALVVLAGGESGRRDFMAGLLVGAAAATSVKTVFLVAGLGLAFAATWLGSATFRGANDWQRLAARVGLGLLGALVVPGAFVGVFAVRGALGPMWHCLFEINAPDSPGMARLALGLGLAAGALLVTRVGGAARPRGWVDVMFLTGALYVALIVGLSPSLKKQTFLPALPLVLPAIVAVAAGWRPRALPWAGLAACLGLSAHQVVEAAPWRDGLAEQRALLRDMQALTAPGEFLMDRKGETIFRRRPIFLAYVQATVRAMEGGRTPEESPERLAATGTAVAIGGGDGLPRDMRRFLKTFYVPVGDGRLRVAGAVAERRSGASGPEWGVPLALPGAYVMLAGGVDNLGVVEVGKPGWTPVPRAAETAQPILLFWKTAWDRGARPQVSAIADLRGDSARP